MNVEVAKSDLEVALSVAGVSVDTSASDLSSHYLFRTRNNQVEILSYGPRIFSRFPLAATCDGEDGDAFTVESWRLDKWMAGARDGVLSLSSQGSGDVKVSDGRSTIRLRSLDPLEVSLLGLTCVGSGRNWVCRSSESVIGVQSCQRLCVRRRYCEA